MESKLYVGNLPYTATEEELSSMFGQAGSVTSVAIIKDRETGRSKGFAFVEMGSNADAQKAVSMLNGQNMGGRDLRVSIARPREEGGGGGGGRGGSYGNRGGNRSGGGGGGGNRRDY
jgi:RNA recognition motif-containing protein